MLILIPIGWLLALFVGAATEPLNLIAAFQAGFLSLLVPVWVLYSIADERKEIAQCRVSIEQAERDGQTCIILPLALEASQDMERILLHMCPWCIAFAAAVPALVLWRLGGAS
jgi:hypothetical protein